MNKRGQKYISYGIRPPYVFKKSSLTTLNVGKHKVIGGKLIANDEWRTQAVLVKKSHAKDLWKITKEIINKAQEE